MCLEQAWVNRSSSRYLTLVQLAVAILWCAVSVNNPSPVQHASADQTGGKSACRTGGGAQQGTLAVRHARREGHLQSTVLISGGSRSTLSWCRGASARLHRRGTGLPAGPGGDLREGRLRPSSEHVQAAADGWATSGTLLPAQYFCGARGGHRAKFRATSEHGSLQVRPAAGTMHTSFEPANLPTHAPVEGVAGWPFAALHWEARTDDAASRLGGTRSR